MIYFVEVTGLAASRKGVTMPIEFHCPSCDRLLRTADGTQGKRAQCAGCGQIATIPPTGADGPSADQPGPAEARSPTEAEPVNPYVTPTVAPTSDGASAGSSDGTRTGPPWDRDGHSFRTFWQTAKLVVGSPVQMFSTMRREGGLGGPILFAVVGGLAGGLANATWMSLLPISVLSQDGVFPGQDTGTLAGLVVVQIVLTFAWTLVMGTVGVLLGVISGAGVIHLALMLLGGANQSFEATCRVICYVQGTIALFQVVPCVGPLIGAVYYSVAAIVGMAETHEISRGKAIAALLLPVLVLMVLGMVGLATGVYFLLSQAMGV